jgi:hypothetical protein
VCRAVFVCGVGEMTVPRKPVTAQFANVDGRDRSPL